MALKRICVVPHLLLRRWQTVPSYQVYAGIRTSPRIYINKYNNRYIISVDITDTTVVTRSLNSQVGSVNS